jgi:hypothetical protein
MPLGDPYAMIEDLESRLGQTDDGTFERLLDAASRAVEAFTHRQFNMTDQASPRRYRALDRERVAVDDFHTLEDLEVEVDGVAWDVNTYIDARPWDGLMAGQLGWPYSDLFAINRSWPWARRARITVTAQWGWLAVPAAIVEATLDVAEEMWLARAQTVSSSIRSRTFDNYSESFGDPTSGRLRDNVPPEFVRALPYRRKVFGVA